MEMGKKYVPWVYLNHTSANDSISGKLLQKQLISVKNDSWITNWLCSYPSEREQNTVFVGKCSTSLISHAGVPQRAVLSLVIFSPLLCMICHPPQKTLFKYAYDLTVCVPISIISNTLEMNEILCHIERWSVVNGRAPNRTKCQTVDSNQKNEQHLNILLESRRGYNIGESLLKVICLGVSFSFDLCWSSYALLLYKEVLHLTYYIKKLNALPLLDIH